MIHIFVFIFKEKCYTFRMNPIIRPSNTSSRAKAPPRTPVKSVQYSLADLKVTPLPTQKQLPPSHLEVKNITFSQSSVASTFSDGQQLSDVTKQLICGWLEIADIPVIRVIKYNGKWIALDNRRLRVFKDAFIDSIPVVVCNLKDPEIAKEFWEKEQQVCFKRWRYT